MHALTSRCSLASSLGEVLGDLDEGGASASPAPPAETLLCVSELEVVVEEVEEVEEGRMLWSQILT